MFNFCKCFCAFFVIIVFFMVFSAQADSALLGSTGNSGANVLISIDPATGAGTAIAPQGTLGPVTALKARSDGVLFGTTGGGTGNTITINPITGVETLVGTAPGTRGVNGLEFVGSTLYGARWPSSTLGGCCSDLVTLDQTNGNLTVIAPFRINGVTGTWVTGIAYDQNTGTMYAVTFSGGISLSTVNLTNGFATVVGPFGGFNGTRALEFDDTTGILYAGASGGRLLTINTATGTATEVGPTGFAISGLAFLDITDTDGDTIIDLVDTDDDNDGVLDGSDTDSLNPDVCEDVDADTCDDCAVGTDDFGPLADNDPFNDGTDTDSDGLCDAGDTDDDNDGVLDGNDTDPLNPDVCEDVDADTCDDCAVGTDDFGPLPDNDPFNDGLDVSGDGICNAGLPIPAVNKWGMMIFMVLAGLGSVYYLIAVPLR